MVDSTTATMIPLPLNLTHKIISSFNMKDSGVKFKGSKSGKNDDEKSFNRYVRQLVDQYLDKEVVISKQPEDKVELIVQACRDRFPEYAHWTTTRIRIYIESCRRLKKIKGSPILLAKRKAAGRRFREGQKLKKMLTSQLTVQANESHRQLAEYLLKGSTSPPPLSTNTGPATMLPKEEPMKLSESEGTCTSEPMVVTGPPPEPVMSTDNVITSAPSLQPLFGSSLRSLNPSVIGSMMQLQNSLITTPSFTGNDLSSTFLSRTSPPISISPPSSVSPQPPRISPLRPTITLPESPTSLFSQVEPSAASVPSPAVSPKQKSFQIDSLIMKCEKKKPLIPIATTASITSSSSSASAVTTTSFPQILDQPIFSSSSGPEMSMSEILNAKTLVTSYREAANFLYRAASELEQLLPNNHRVF